MRQPAPHCYFRTSPSVHLDAPKSALLPVQSRVEYSLRHLPRRSIRDIPMKRSSTIVVAALLFGSLASVAQQPAPTLTGDAKPDSGIMNVDVYTNQFFGF